MFYWNAKIYVTTYILRIKFNINIRIQFGFDLDLKWTYNTNNIKYDNCTYIGIVHNIVTYHNNNYYNTSCRIPLSIT